ncbi:MAG: hypothetical protein ACI8QD_002837, partial [Cyclobacteriaceae bacterium]
MSSVHLYTFCYNESYFIPFFLAHYAPWVSRIVVYDNQSSDDSVTLLQQSSKVEVRTWDTNNQIRDDLKVQLMSNAWKESKGTADWVIVCDMDELLYHPQITQLLPLLRQQEYTVCRPLGYEMISEQRPDHGSPLLQQVREGIRQPYWDKMVLFDPNEINEINFSPGGHYSLPEGRVRAFFRQEELKLLHYRYLGLDYILNKHLVRNTRLSEINRRNGWGQQ